MRPFEGGSGLDRPLRVDRVMGEPTSEVTAFAPVGTVTFLLIDIAGSTQPWDGAADVTPEAIARHYEILVEAIARSGGAPPVEHGEGGGVVAAFTRASDGLSAALDAQRALLADDWPRNAMPVRMALHSENAGPRDRVSYLGAAVNRGTHLRAIAHGGQVLLSRATHDLVKDGLPDGVELVDLGIHRLRDLGPPEHVFAPAHPDLPLIGEPLRSLDVLPNNLPMQLSSFVGRARELVEVGEALASTRLLTLTGAGGCGKTRLALQATADALDRFPDGTWWVELATVSDPDLVGSALAEAIGVRPLPGASPLEAAVAHVAPRRALVLLDNCEHLLESCARVVTALLEDCPGVAVAVTSREPLGVPGETTWRVPSLSLPAEREPEAAQALGESDAVRLFIERALEVRPNFAAGEETAPAVARICHELDGIPLAIELAAARVRMLAPGEIEAGLADRFRLLTGAARTALPRQQTLRASVDWSHELLDEPERTLLRRLGAFVGGFTLDACEEVCADERLGRTAILDVLTSLVDKSLIGVEEGGKETRYRLLETVRHYAIDRLTAAGERERLRNRHRDAFVAFGERVEPDLLSQRQPEALQLLDAEAANLHAAIECAARTEPGKALRLGSALALWWRTRGLFATGEAALRLALEAAPEEPAPLRARALWARAYLAAHTGEQELSQRSATEALAIGEELQDEWIQGRALHALVQLELPTDPPGAVRTAELSRDFARAAGDEFVLADVTQVLGVAHWFQGDYEAARREFDLAVELGQRLGNREILAWDWFLQGITPWGSADLAQRRALIERGLAVSAEVGEPVTEGFGMVYLAFLEVWSGAPAIALERLERGLEPLVAAGAAWPIAYVQWALGLAQASLGRLDEARATLAEVVERDGDGWIWTLGWTLCALASVERLRGEVAAARSCGERALEVSGRVGSALLAASAQHELGRLAAGRAEWAEAEQLLHHSLGALVEGDQLLYVPDSLEALAEVASGLESHAEAARLLAATARARADLGLGRWTAEDQRWAALERELRRALGDDACEAAAAQGRALTMGDAVAYARRARGSRKRPPGGWESLTPTELDVARHAADGLTNPEIGERMFISRATVKVHLSHIYGKLGVRNRAELAAEVARRNGHPK